MSKGTAIKAAIAAFEKAREGTSASEAEKVELWGQVPPIDKMDGSLAALKACKHLSLSTNNIEKIAGLAGLQNLRVLSLGRNQIKKLEQLDPVANTLEELWVSYNVLEKLTGLEKLINLRVLYASNNKLKDWPEVERLSTLKNLEELLLTGNPLHTDFRDRGVIPEYRLEVIKRLPNLKKLDGAIINPEEREAAAKALTAAG